MNIKEILTQNGYEIPKTMTEEILNYNTGICTEIREIPNDISKLFDGVEIYNTGEELKIITINFQYFNGDDEFLPLTVGYIGKDGFLSVEVYYDEKMEVVFINDLR